MRFTALHILIAFAAGSLAYPSAGLTTGNAQEAKFVELFRQPTRDPANNHHLVFLGPPNGTHPEPNEHQKRGGCSSTSQPSCSSSNTARNDICESLITELNGDAQVAVPNSPRQICYEGDAADSDDNAYCCVSWGTAVNNLEKGDLASYAATITSQCTQNGVSGKFSSVPLGPLSTCSEFCTSSRGDHC
ncbi:hypothetical protein EV356DRAFT_520461 [Viridothelium virens]|uniref:WD-like domain-containing protein n=1 Tax=Viridothelium virens TaxID=1048519 RepID=A0A6A6GW13_VIRVR|nr:hypothetical protein EV356DRAFT_520461 [Viridothelium virens]